jgi:outer membrane protein TolC
MRAAAARLIRAQAEQDAARADVDVDVVTALRRVESARARRDAGRAAVAQARESERVVRDRFDAGLAQVGDVLRASSAVLDAEADATSALVDTVVGAAALRRALGRVQ